MMKFILPNPSYLNSPPEFKAMLFSLIALTAVSTPLIMQLPLSIITIFIVFLTLRFILLFLHKPALKSWQLILLMLAFTGLIFQQLGTILGLEGGISFLLLLAVLKSYEGNTRRDWQVLALVMLFLLTGAVLFEDGLLTALWVFTCLMMMGISLSMLNSQSFTVALRHSTIAFMLTLLPMILLFVVVPRKSTPLWGMPQPTATQSTTGISDTMKPGSISDLILNNEPAFTATFEGVQPQQNQLYWRIMVMGEYREGAWRTLRDFTDTAEPSLLQTRIPYQIIIEDQKGRIPALDYPFTPTQRGLFREMGNVLRTFHRDGVRRIQLESSLSDTLPHRLNPTEKRYYTYLPQNSNPQTQDLAKRLYQQSHQDTETFIQNAYHYFTQQGFTYTLKPPILSEQNSTDEFIFQSKQGFCEHYADAFVVLMRAAGVPARIVTGYQGGEYNAQGNFWQIRSKDAHAWVEVWLPEKQIWKRIDPTGAVASIRINQGLNAALSENEANELAATERPWQRLIDQSRFYWQQWVVNYDNTSQLNLFNHLGFDKVNFTSVLTLLLLGLLPAILPIWAWWQRSRRQDINPLSYGFAHLKQQLLGKDYPAIHAIGPLELQQQLKSERRLNAEIMQLIQSYISLNYQNPHPTAKHIHKWYRQALKISKKYRIKL